MQCRGRFVARQHALGAGAVGGPDDDELGRVAFGDGAQRVRGRAVRDHERPGRHAYARQLALDQDQDVLADERLGRAGMHGEELAVADGLQQRGQRERVTPALAAINADDDAREHQVLLGSRHGIEATPGERRRHRGPPAIRRGKPPRLGGGGARTSGAARRRPTR